MCALASASCTGDILYWRCVLQGLTKLLTGASSNQLQCMWPAPAAASLCHTTHMLDYASVQVLRGYLELFISEEAVTSDGSRPRPLPGTHNASLPSSSKPLDYTSLIDALSESDSPALFGLPANIHRSAGHAASTAVIAQLKQITSSQVSDISSAAYLYVR